MLSKAIGALAGALAATCICAGSAQGLVTCSLNSERAVLEIDLNDRHDYTRIDTHDHIGPPEIVVRDDGSTADCAGPDPNTRNVDLIRVEDLSDGGTAVAVDSPDHFAPGSTSAGGDGGGDSMNEIEFRIRMGAEGWDQLTFRGYAAPDVRWRFGTAGFNPRVERTGSRDADITYTGVEKLQAIGGSANDVLRADGGAGTGAPLQERIHLHGGNGDDLVRGGSGPDHLDGGIDDDELQGMDGADLLVGGFEADTLSGGLGADTASWPFLGANSAVFADIGQGGANDGAANDESREGGHRDRVMDDVENLSGGGEPDILIGDDEDNVIYADHGDVDKRITCGGGRDLVFADPDDRLMPSCERVKRPLTR